MSSTSSQGLAASASDLDGPECEPSRSVRSTPIAGKSSPSIGPMSPATTTCEPSPPIAFTQMEFGLMPSAAASPAKTSALPARVPALRVSEADYGANTPELLASFDPSSSSWRTSQHSLEGGLTEFSETWPRSGTMRNGIAYPLPPLVHLTDAIGSGLWPTPTVGGGGQTLPEGTTPTGITPSGRKQTVCLERYVKQVENRIWPTPTVAMHKGSPLKAMTRKTGASRLSDRLDYATERGIIANGRLNPTWVEWLMGFPTEWTALKVSATPSSRKSRKSSDVQS